MRGKAPAVVVLAAMLLFSLFMQNPFAAAISDGKTIGQHVPNDEAITIESIEFSAKKKPRTEGTIVVEIFQGGTILDSVDVSIDKIRKNKYAKLNADFGQVEVAGSDFDILFTFEGSGDVTIKKVTDKKNRLAGNTFEGDKELAKHDLVLKIRTTDEDNWKPTVGEPPQVTQPTNPNPPQQTQQQGTRTLVIASKNVAGNSDITGLYVTVTSSDGTVNGFTTMSLSVKKGMTYAVSISDFGDTQFERWENGETSRTRTVTVSSDMTITAFFRTGSSSNPPTNYPTPTPPPPASDPAGITVHAYRIPSWHWGATFTSANANMYFVLYDSSGTLIQTGFADENGYTFGGLQSGATYYLYPTDCNGCHASEHDVIFRYWEDSSTERPRALTPGVSVGAYFEYVEWQN